VKENMTKSKYQIGDRFDDWKIVRIYKYSWVSCWIYDLERNDSKLTCDENTLGKILIDAKSA